ncbi:mitotic checkpoint serine/threonine-protein kinase BUB1 beta [Discoglossus pictus]
MEKGDDNWELSKENVQPLRKGRAMSTLQVGLSQQMSSSQTSIQQQKQAFESELRFYSGEDPLDVWDRYIKWAEQAFPQGGNESNLAPLLERAVKNFYQEKRYYGDLRYLNLWLKFAQLCSEPLDLYSYLHSEGIGISHAQLYITWAEENETRGNYKKADSIFQEGIQRKAEPLDKLEVQHRQFQARVSRQIVQGIAEGQDDDDSDVSEPQRSTLADLKSKGKNKARVPVSRVGDAVKPRSQSLSAQAAPQQQIPRQSRFAVFDENSTAPVAGQLPFLNPQPWEAPPPVRAKENELKPGPWNSKRSSRSSHTMPNLEPAPIIPNFIPYVEESAQQATVTPCKVNPAITSVLSARKPGKEEDPLQRIQNVTQGKEERVMYCKNKVYAGVDEFSLEEIRAEMYMAKLRKKREEELKARALRRQEMERQIEEMEKQLKDRCLGREDSIPEPRAQDQVPCTEQRSPAESTPLSPADAEPLAADPPPLTEFTETSVTAHPRVRGLSLPNVQQDQPSPLGSSSDCPFTIFDESTSETQPRRLSNNLMPPPVHCPILSPFSETNDCVKPEVASFQLAQDEQFPKHEGSSIAAPQRLGILSLQSVQQDVSSPLCSSSEVPFTIFDESASEMQPIRPPRNEVQPPGHRPPLSDFSKGKDYIEGDSASVPDELDGIEPIVSGSDKNKTLFADPEDTCDFVRAAQLASTPFQRTREVSDQSQLCEISELERIPLREKTPVSEESYGVALCIKKLSPILEASQEDTRSSVSSVSSISSTTSMFGSKSLHIPEKLELSTKIIETCEPGAEEPPQVVVIEELRRQLLEPFFNMSCYSEIHQEAGPMPVTAKQAEVQLGSESYRLTNEVMLSSKNRLYLGVPGESDLEYIKGVAVKVDNQPIPWDFYIMQQLKERLGDVLETDFMGQSNCFLFQDGCITLYKDINRVSIADIFQHSADSDIILLIAYNLLSLVAKLHSVEILHGDLRLETILLNDRAFDLACTEMDGFLRLIDFTHSMDLRTCTTLTSLSGFAFAQTDYGRQFLAHRSSPYQVDFLGIADVIHLLIFRKHLQLHQEDGVWQISEEIPRSLDGNLWNKFFTRILNAGDEATTSTLKELKDEMSQLFNSSLQDRVIDYFLQLELSLPFGGNISAT